MTPRLRAESTGESVTLLDRCMVALLSKESGCGRPTLIHSVLEELGERKFSDARRILDAAETAVSP